MENLTPPTHTLVMSGIVNTFANLLKIRLNSKIIIPASFCSVCYSVRSNPECLPRILETLGSVPSTAKKEKKEKENLGSYTQ